MREEWLKGRSKGIGGSDAAPICGVSPWKSAYQVWLEKRGEADGPQEDNDAMLWGRTLEPVIRQRYADVTGRTVTVPNEILVHPKYDWMLASLDGIAGDRVLEVKTARSPIGWGDEGTNEIPEYYLCQITHYMTVTGLSKADVAALIGGSDFRIYEVEADPVLQDLLINREAAFWDMVQKGIPPEPTTYADIKQRFGKMSKAVSVKAVPAIIRAVERIKELKELEIEVDACKAIITGYMKEADTLMDGDKVLATWKLSKPTKRFDTKALQEIQPETYAQFLKEGEPSRRLLIK